VPPACLEEDRVPQVPMDAGEVNQIWQGRREGVCGAKSTAPNAMHRNGARWAGRATEAGRSRVPPAAQKAEAISNGNVIYLKLVRN
jgi:hypothetical protein